MSTPSTIAPGTTPALQSMIAGDAFVPEDPGHDDARRTLFLRLDQRPSAVVLAESVADAWAS